MRTPFVVLGLLVVSLVLVACDAKKPAAAKPAAAKPVATKASGDAVKAAKKPQTICPVMGNPINKSLYVDVKGKRIYVCCQGCIPKVKADPDKYIKILEDQGVAIEAVPAAGK